MNAIEETLIQTIAHNYGCIAEVVRRACQMADYPPELLAARRKGYLYHMRHLGPQTDFVSIGYGDSMLEAEEQDASTPL